MRLQEIAKRIKYESIEEIRSSYVEIGDLLKPLVSKLEASTGFKVKEKDINVDDIGWGKVEITKELYFIFPQESQFNERKNLRDLHRLAKIIGNELEGTQTK